jgi:hypothetical protein
VWSLGPYAIAAIPCEGAKPEADMAKSKDDLILVSVDDHIAEPADMFEGHVPEKYRELAPRVVPRVLRRRRARA